MTPVQKILVIDDDERNLQILSLMLTDFYQIELASSGQAGLDTFAVFKPDLVLLDIMMPVIDGFEVCRIIRSGQIRPDVKILLITAKTALEDRLKGYEVGADDYIIKPFDEDELLAKIRVFVRLNEAELQLKQLNRRLLLRQQDIPNLLWECDGDAQFTYLDDNTVQLLGYAPEQLLGKPLTEILMPEAIPEFQLKFLKPLSAAKPPIRALSLVFRTAEGKALPLQVCADSIEDELGQAVGLTGILRDMSAFTQLTADTEELAEELTIRLDRQYRPVHVADSIRPFLAAGQDSLDFRSFLLDSSLGQLLDFAFAQKENVPFPVEVRLLDAGGGEHHFSVQFRYLADGPFLEGQLIPAGAQDQLQLVSQKIEVKHRKIEDQAAELKKAVVIDSEMQESILTDARNLSAETLSLVKSLETYAFPDDSPFSLETYGEFLLNRNLQLYAENLRLLGNKIHGLKGSCGFLRQEAKQLCHRMEEITRPLAELKLVLTQTLSALLKQFVFKIEELLELFQDNPQAEMPVEDWLQKIDDTLERSRAYLAEKAGLVTGFIRERMTDNGEIRQRKKEEYLSVSLEGYEVLADQVKELYYTLSLALDQEKLVQAGTLYNQFLNTHQQIKKIPLNLSRYERLIPKMAKDYDKEADFLFRDHQVKADREFWNLIHEMLNHRLKNAVIHGIEPPEQRK